jgi:hypothetical protein
MQAEPAAGGDEHVAVVEGIGQVRQSIVRRISASLPPVRTHPLSLVGIASSSIVTGNPIDADSSSSSLITLAFETAVSDFGSRCLYV